MKKIPMMEVKSEVLREIGYDPEARELHVLFNASDWIYVYSGVPAELWDELCQSEHRGSLFSAKIRNMFKFRREDPTS